MTKRTEDGKKSAAARKVGKDSIAKMLRDQKAFAAAERKRRAEEKEQEKLQKEKNQTAQSSGMPPLPASPSPNPSSPSTAQVPNNLTTPKANTTAANVSATKEQEGDGQGERKEADVVQNDSSTP